MPFVNVDGQLVEITAEELDNFNQGESQGAIGTIEDPLTNNGSVAAGGTVTVDEMGQEILSPDTTDNTPGQEIPYEYTPESLNALAILNGVDAGDSLPTANGGSGITEQLLYNNELAAQDFALKDQARQQQTIASQRKQINNSDWRVRLRLAPQSDYLYNAPNPGILAPLSSASGTDGIIFPYTPQISTNYRAEYSSYALTHSNYKGYFYTNSFVDAVNVTATFTAQDTKEAEYLLAVIHFFRSATKMFYGQDAQRGSPPPLVFFSGLGEFQFNEHACLISQFTYTLPSDVDYIRARSSNTSGINFTTVREKQSVAVPALSGLSRLANALLPKGGIFGTPAPATLGKNNPTYVPTKMEISLTLLPVQSRNQVSKQFSVKEFANGNLIKGGFW